MKLLVSVIAISVILVALLGAQFIGVIEADQAMVASLSESASALNFGVTINLTVTVNGGKAPYTYAWYMDNQLVETSPSNQYATNALGVGSHHVYVQVNDSGNNSAKTLTIEFDVLPISSASGSSPPTSEQTTVTPTQAITPSSIAKHVPNYSMMLDASMIAVAALVVVIGVAVYLRTRKGRQ